MRIGGPAESAIIVRHLAGGTEVRSAIPPASVVDGLIKIGGVSTGVRGDANADGQVDISDPLGLLSYFFLGSKAPACLGAGDFNLDGKLDLTDPIAILGTLFLGAPTPGGDEPREVPCS